MRVKVEAGLLEGRQGIKARKFFKLSLLVGHIVFVGEWPVFREIKMQKRSF